jgi:FkbM family methyltransferase
MSINGPFHMRNLFKRVLGKAGYKLGRSTFVTDQRCAFSAQQSILDRAGAKDVAIYDVGANDGATAKRYRSLFPQAQIYSFEPYPDSFTKLQDAMRGDRCFLATEVALADKSGEQTLHINWFDPTNSLLPRPVAGKRYYLSQAGPKTTLTVNVNTLDDFVRDHANPKLSIVKMDIQGGELSALRGARSFLTSGKVGIVYLEVMFVPLYQGAPLFHEVCAYLEQLQFTLYDLFDLHRANDGQLRYADAIFISPSVRAKALDTSNEEP